MQAYKKPSPDIHKKMNDHNSYLKLPAPPNQEEAHPHYLFQVERTLQKQAESNLVFLEQVSQRVAPHALVLAENKKMFKYF